MDVQALSLIGKKCSNIKKWPGRNLVLKKDRVDKSQSHNKEACRKLLLSYNSQALFQ